MKFPPWRRREEELEEEIQSHLRMAIRDRMQRGESAEEAESAARREFGNVGLIKETTRAVWGLGRGNVLGPYYEVVGVAKDSKYRSLGEEQQSFFYVSAMQDYRQQMVLHVRTVGEPGLLRSALRDRVMALDKGLMVEVATMRENLAALFLPARVAAVVLGLVGLFGLSLAVVGIYGVVSYAVSRRTGEIGLRMALGAESRDILRAC